MDTIDLETTNNNQGEDKGDCYKEMHIIIMTCANLILMTVYKTNFKALLNIKVNLSCV